MIVTPRVRGRVWLAVGPRSAARLRRGLPTGSAIRVERTVHEAIARLVRDPVDVCLVDAGLLQDRPRAALRTLRRQAGTARLYVLREPRAERSLRAANALGVPVADDAEAVIDAEGLGDEGTGRGGPLAESADPPRKPRRRSRSERPSERGSPAEVAFAEGVLRRIERRRALVRFVLASFAEATGAARASLLLRDAGRDTLCVRAAIGLPEGLVDTVRCTPGAGIAGRAASLGRPLLGQGARGGARGYAGATYAVFPLMAGGAVEGVVCLSSLPDDLAPSDDQVRRLVRMARQAARVLRASRRLRRAESLSARDRLTSLPNRRAFDRALGREMERSRRSGTPLAVAIVDADRFKGVNDGHGHAAGDRVLAEIARRLRVTLRESDLVARYGGEEFGILLTGLPAEPVPEGLRILERVRHAIRALPLATGSGSNPVRMTVSIGFAVFAPRGGDLRDADGLLKAADAALYRAKDGGRDRVVGP